MKTIQVPDDFDEYLLEKMVSKDWLSEWWYIDDVKDSVPNITDQQARDVLESLGRYHDANLGINWEVIQSTADQLFDLEECEE